MHLSALAQMQFPTTMWIPILVLREWRHHVLLAAHPSAACPDVSLADKAAGRPCKQITDHPEWDVLFVESEYILKL